MARIRTIKPEFWTDEKILQISRDARLFFIALWNFADDNGVVEYKPLQLKALIFPLDQDIGPEEIKALVAELEKVGLVITYEVEGEPYLWIKNFTKHQKVDRPRKSSLPLPIKEYLEKKTSDDFNESQKTSDDFSELQETSDNFSRLQETSDDFNEHQKISDDFSRFQLKSSEISLGIGKGIGKEKEREKEGKEVKEEEGKKEEEKAQEKFRSANALRVLAANATSTTDEPQENSPPLKSKEAKQKNSQKSTNKENFPPPCPYQEIVKLYHSALPELPQCKVLNEARKSFIRARWREVLTNPELMAIMVPEHEELVMHSDRQKGLLWFERYFRYVAESDFLTGKVPPSNGRSKPFMADLEWLMRPQNFAKVLEGRYHTRDSPFSKLSSAGRKTAMAAMELIQELKMEEERNGMVH